MPPSEPKHPGRVLWERGLGPSAGANQLGQAPPSAQAPAGPKTGGGPPGVVSLPGPHVLVDGGHVESRLYLGHVDLPVSSTTVDVSIILDTFIIINTSL